MLNATRYLAYTFVLSYLLCLLFVGLRHGTLYQDPLHLQYLLMSLGLAYLVQFVQSQTMLSIIFAVMLTALVKIVTQLYGWPVTERVVASLNIGYFICYLLCIVQLAKLKRQLKNQPKP